MSIWRYWRSLQGGQWLTRRRKAEPHPPKAGVVHGVWQQVDQDWQELNTTCPSRALGCHRQPPLQAHLELLTPRRLYVPEQETALFDLARVDAIIAQGTWIRTVNDRGRLSLGGQPYGLTSAWAKQKVTIRFDPTTRTLQFTALQPNPALPPITRPALGVRAEDIIGPITPYQGPPHQLALPLSLGRPPLPAGAA